MAVTTTYTHGTTAGVISLSQAVGTQRGATLVGIGDGNSAAFYYDVAASEIAARTVSGDGVLSARVTASTTGVLISNANSGQIEPVSAAQLNNGNIVLVWASSETTPSVYFRVFDSSLNPVTSGALAEVTTVASIRPDVAALADGGFVIVWEKNWALNESDIVFRRFNASGVSTDAFTGVAIMSFGTADEAPSVAGLVNGGFAVGWHRRDGITGETDAYFAVRNADGTQRLAPTLFDGTGAINRDLSVVARNDGNFALYYEDSQTSGTSNTNLHSWHVDANTGSRYLVVASSQNTNNGDAATAVSEDGFIAATYTAGNAAGAYNQYLSFLGPDGAVLTTDIPISTSAQDEVVSGVTWISPTEVRVTHERVGSTGGAGDTDNSVDSRVYFLVRQSQGNADNDTINLVNDGLKDTMNGGDGNDVLVSGDGDDSLFGGNNNDVLIGGAGNDNLDGGNGSNELYGGPGDDRFVISTVTNTIIELAGEGTDQVISFLANYTLPSHVEILTFSTVTGVTGVGNALDNVMASRSNSHDTLIGNDGNDRLDDGAGSVGTGEDTLIGGNGDDTYSVRVRGTSTLESPGGGTDTVEVNFSVYGLQANIEILRAEADNVHDALVGNTLDNEIYGRLGVDGLFGREGNDQLFGGIGAANTLVGQEGDDTYYVEAIGDTVLEFAGQGIDTVVPSIANFTLPANVENLTFSSGTHIGIGNALGNTLTGGSGSDFLSGLDGDDVLIGRSGFDELQGGAGADQFRYLGTESGGIDRIYDFAPGTDDIGLSLAGFTPTATRNFVQGTAPAPTTTNSTLIYNTTTGIISYDDDGTGAGAAVQLTQLNAGLTLSLGDFIFF